MFYILHRQRVHHLLASGVEIEQRNNSHDAELSREITRVYLRRAVDMTVDIFSLQVPW